LGRGAVCAHRRSRRTQTNRAGHRAAFRSHASIFGATAGQACGFLDTPAWKLLHNALQWQEGDKKSTFFSPNPGVLYPAVYELAERALAASKSLRSFAQSPQEGWRCSLSGEAEWLTTDRSQLSLPPGQRSDTLWTRIAKAKPAWAKKGEHLAALPAIKRLWPTLFANEVGKALDKPNIGRFIVSTHTMALAHQLDEWLQHGGRCTEQLNALQQRYRTQLDPVSLPRLLMLRHQRTQADALKDAAQLPALLDLANDDQTSEQEAAAIRRAVRQTLARCAQTKATTGSRPTTACCCSTATAWVNGSRATAPLATARAFTHRCKKL